MRLVPVRGNDHIYMYISLIIKMHVHSDCQIMIKTLQKYIACALSWL